MFCMLIVKELVDDFTQQKEKAFEVDLTKEHARAFANGFVPFEWDNIFFAISRFHKAVLLSNIFDQTIDL